MINTSITLLVDTLFFFFWRTRLCYTALDHYTTHITLFIASKSFNPKWFIIDHSDYSECTKVLSEIMHYDTSIYD